MYFMIALLALLFGAVLILISLKAPYRKGIVLTLRTVGIVVLLLGLLCAALLLSGHITLPIQ